MTQQAIDQARKARANALAEGGKWAVERAAKVTHHKAFSHGHHLLYVGYYALELLHAEKPAHFALVGGILAFTALAAIGGE